VWLTSLRATVSPAVQFGSTGGGASGGAGATGAIRGSQQVPAVEIVGCTTNQAEVARVLTRLRLVQAVSHVTLVESAKSDQVPAGGGASSGASGGGVGNQDCRHGSQKFPRFQLVAFFDPLPGASAGTGTAGSAAPPASSSKPPASTSSTSSARAGSTSPPDSSSSAPRSAAPAARRAAGGSR
jgi:hypothetical protein